MNLGKTYFGRDVLLNIRIHETDLKKNT